MSHDAEYAQKRLLEEKKRTWEAETLSTKVQALAGRMDQLEKVLEIIRRDVQGIRTALSTR